MSLFAQYHKKCVRPAPTPKSPTEPLPANSAEAEPEPESEPPLAPNNEQVSYVEEEYIPLIPADEIDDIPPEFWWRPNVKEWYFDECNESWAKKKPGPVGYEDEFSLKCIYSHEKHDGKIFYACRWSGWPPAYDTLEPEESVFDSKAFYDYALASLNLNIGSKRKLKAKRTGALRYASKKFKSDTGLKIILKLNLREPKNVYESLMYDILKRSFKDEKYSEATGFYRYLKKI